MKKNKNKMFMALAATTMSVATFMSVEDVKASELNIATAIKDNIVKAVTLEATKHIELEDVAEAYTNIDKFYESYKSELVGLDVKFVEDLNLLEKKVIVQIDLNKVNQNFDKTIQDDNPFKDFVKTFKENPEYLEELKLLSQETKNPLIIEQVITADLLKNQYKIASTLKMGELHGDTDYEYVDMLRYKKTTATFSDINTHWSKENILSLAEIGIVSGSNGKFKPQDNLTRGQFVAMLARTIPNADLQNKKSKFTDISTHWAKNDIILLNQLGIIDGVNETTFNPNAPITRQQAAKILVRYVELLGIDLEDIPSELKFADASKISSYAKEPVGQLYSLGIISGSVDKNGKTNFNPSGKLTRAQMAKMLNGLLKTSINDFNTK